ncbi:hypothetical protein [Paenibacillus koleovorans]|uniref:hypothetical protein n=1 Tax=Paenibacillus koleovorans TaxID=121608 RepID=UPI000FD772B9|nr:hypothetical protein [Paenibacillus koleovorans]
MKSHKRLSSRQFLILTLLAVLSLTFAPFAATSPAQAAKEGVFLSNDVFFTVDDVVLSTGSASQTLRYSLTLTNNGETMVDYNAYGIRISDPSGSSYSAQLTEKTNARVQPHKSQTFKYTSNIALGLSPSDLSVVLFAWDSSEADYMRDFGTLSIGASMSEQAFVKESVLINVKDIDAANMPNDGVVSLQAISSTKTVKDGVWTMSVDLRAENLGSSAFKLPSALTYQLVDERGLAFAATAVAGNDTLLPRQATKLTLQATVGGSFSDNRFTIEYLNKTQTATTLVGSLTITRGEALQVGQVQDYPMANPNGLSVSIDSASYKSQVDGVSVEAVVTLNNGSKSIVSVPTLSASYQLNSNGLSVAAGDTSAAAAYLSPGNSVTKTFRATLPLGADLADTNLVLSEKKGTSTVILPVVSASLAKASPNGTGVSAPAEGDIVSTSVGSLAIQVKRTQRLTLESDDVLLTEIAVKNVTGSVITLPALYGGYTLGDFEVTGKAVRLQSSAYLNPNEATTIYLYAKIPYTLDSSNGGFFFGEGTAQAAGGNGNGQTGGNSGTGTSGAVTPTRQWLNAAFALNDDGIAPIEKSAEWKINDQGRQSVGAVIDSQVFTLGTQKMLAVRILQTGKEKRVGNIVPYIGYFIGPDGSIWNAKVTEESGRFCNGCVALNTLWVTLPEAMSGSLRDYELVFGQKLDDTAMASVHRFSLLNLGNQLPLPVARAGTDSTVLTKITNAEIVLGTFDLYPYNVTINNLSAYKVGLSGNKYEVNFNYTQDKLYPVAGGNKNRSLVFELRDDRDMLMKTWDIPFEGTGSMVNGAVKLSADVTATDVTPTTSPRVYVYEKFEGALRLLGSNTAPYVSQ